MIYTMLKNVPIILISLIWLTVHIVPMHNLHNI